MRYGVAKCLWRASPDTLLCKRPLTRTAVDTAAAAAAAAGCPCGAPSDLPRRGEPRWGEPRPRRLGPQRTRRPRRVWRPRRSAASAATMSRHRRGETGPAVAALRSDHERAVGAFLSAMRAQIRTDGLDRTTPARYLPSATRPQRLRMVWRFVCRRRFRNGCGERGPVRTAARRKAIHPAEKASAS